MSDVLSLFSRNSLRAVRRPTPVWKTLRLTYDPTLERNLMCVSTKAATRPFPTPQIGRNIRIAHTQMRYRQTGFKKKLCCFVAAWICCVKISSSFFLFIFRNRMCVKSQAAPNATRTRARYVSTWRRCTGRRHTSPRNSVEIIRALRPNLGSLGATARDGHQGNCPWVGIRTKGSTTTLPQNRMNVCRSSPSRQRSPWWDLILSSLTAWICILF